MFKFAILSACVLVYTIYCSLYVGIGCVHAMELLQKYSGEGLDALRKIK